jgi:hypothetical protein
MPWVISTPSPAAGSRWMAAILRTKVGAWSTVARKVKVSGAVTG